MKQKEANLSVFKDKEMYNKLIISVQLRGH